MTYIDHLREVKGDNVINIALGKLPEADVKYANGDREFALWMYLVDRQIARRCGMTHHDMADRIWRDDYDAGSTPREAVEEAVADEFWGWE